MNAATAHSPDLIPVIAGPTAVGKSALALELAEAIEAEIVSADSRQIYRHLDIGTAKPSPEEQSKIRHHFVDELSLDEPMSAGIFERQARIRIDDITAEGRRVVVAGGSTLYLHALLYGLADIPDVPDEIARDTNHELERIGSLALHQVLAASDPNAAARIDPLNPHRVARALNVFRATGRSIDSFHSAVSRDARFHLFVLDRPREELYRRINARVDKMMAAGLLDEVVSLHSTEADRSHPALLSIGYRELLEFLDGAHTLDDAISLIKRNSRRYAKRQLTWFRRYDDASWLDGREPVGTLLSKVRDTLAARGQ